MLTFLRRIRKGLLNDGATSKYLLYAIGEIALVVIGILIALQINNWNQQLKEREQEKKLLVQLKNEYDTNLKQLDSKIATRKIIIQSAKDILSYIDNPQTVIKDSLFIKMNGLAFATTYDPIENDLVSSGRMDIIKNEKLKELLTKWSSDVVQVKEAEAIYWDHWHDIFQPMLWKTGLERSLSTSYWNTIGDRDFLLKNDRIEAYDLGRSKHEIEISELLNSIELEFISAKAIGANIFINLESFTLREQIIEILTILNQEIIKLK